MTNADDRLDIKLSNEVDEIIKNPNLTRCYRSKVWPDHIKCFIPNTSNNKQTCQKIFDWVKIPGSWFYCSKEDDKIFLMIQKKQ